MFTGFLLATLFLSESNAEEVNKIPLALQTAKNTVATDTGFWGNDGQHSINVINFLAPQGAGSQGGWNIYKECVGHELWHPQHIVRLVNKNGRAYFVVAQSDQGDGFITVLETFEGKLDTETDLVVGRTLAGGVDTGNTGEYIWSMGFPTNGANNIGAWNHPGKMQILGDLLVVAAQNWGSDCPLPDGKGASPDALLFFDVRNPKKPQYIGHLDEDELGVNEVSTIRIARTPEGIYILTADDDERYALLTSPRISTNIHD